MDIFEKQQTIETLQSIVKARWFYVSALLLQGLIFKFFFTSVPLPTSWFITIVVVTVLLLNSIFWLYARRPLEKIDSRILEIIKSIQVPMEQVAIAAILFFSGTANKMLMMMFIIPIMVGAAIYKKKGIVLATFSTMFIYSGLVFLEYFGLLPYLSPESAAQSAGKLLRGDWFLVKGQLIAFNLYMVGAAFYAAYLSNLFKRREKRLVEQKNELGQNAEQLTVQTQELTKTKDYLHEALTKSDKARAELEQTKVQLEKTNVELKAKLDELEKYGQVTTGRELKMIELKDEIKNLRETVEKLKGQLTLNK